MEATAKARFQRIATRKARMVCDMVRGKNAAVALDELRFTRKAAAPIVAKLLDSAIANARDRDQSVDLDGLFVKTIYADKAPDSHMRRWRPRAHGRATRIAKGMSHITVVVATREEG
jgi:large subunit ribosomal protein L22